MQNVMARLAQIHEQAFGADEALAGVLLKELSAQPLLNDALRDKDSRDILVETAMHLIGLAPLDARVLTVSNFLDATFVPRELAMAFGRDVLEVAGPLLAHPSAMSEVDLALLARLVPVSHQLVIASRPMVPVSVSNPLVTRGVDAVLYRLVANHGAIMSRSSMIAIAERAPADRAMREYLAMRRDLPEPVAIMLADCLALPLAARLLAADARYDQNQAHELIARAQQFALEKQEAAGAQRRAGDGLAAFRAGEMSLDDAIIALAREDRAAEVASLLAEATGQDEMTTLNAIFLRLYDATVFCARAAGLSEAALDAIIAMRGRVGARCTLEAMGAHALFDRTEKFAARAAMSAIATAISANQAMKTELNQVA